MNSSVMGVNPASNTEISLTTCSFGEWILTLLAMSWSAKLWELQVGSSTELCPFKTVLEEINIILQLREQACSVAQFIDPIRQNPEIKNVLRLLDKCKERF